MSERRELSQALLEWKKGASVEAGALSCHVYEDLESPAVFCLTSQWQNRETYEAHLRGPKFGAILGALQLLALPPEFVVMESSEPNGGAAQLTLQDIRAQRGAGVR